MDNISKYIDLNKDRFVKELQKLCRQKSISAQNTGMQKTKELVKQLLRNIGAEVQELPAANGFPAVYGMIKGQGSKSLLLYNHYDVQPPEPLPEWTHQPFSAAIEDGNIYARGAADNKGDLIARISAVETFLKVNGSLPINVIFFVEGEEEIGSPNLKPIVEKNTSLLNADCCIWESGSKTFSGSPCIYLGVKGMLYVQLETAEITHDLHSSLATTIPNAVWKLVWALNTMKNSREHILIPGFYDDVTPLTEEEKTMIRNIPPEDKKLKEEVGLKNFVLDLEGEKRIIRDLSEPTCTICGIDGGYTGPGPKTVLPREARAKIDFRLVPDQDPDDILAKLKNHLKATEFANIHINKLQAEKPFKTSPQAEITQVAKNTAREIYQTEPVIYPTWAATGPMDILCGKLNMPCVSVGVSHKGSRMHGPDENIRVEDFIQGIKHIAAIMHSLGSQTK